MTGKDYADDLALLADPSAQTEFLWHNMEKTARGIGHNMNAYDMGFICFKREGAISKVLLILEAGL